MAYFFFFFLLFFFFFLFPPVGADASGCSSVAVAPAAADASYTLSSPNPSCCAYLLPSSMLGAPSLTPVIADGLMGICCDIVALL